jgi:heterodisulfide reductase subunit C
LVSNEKTVKNATSDFADKVINSGSKIFQRDDLQRFKACMQCGMCVGSCPSGRMTAWRIRRIFEKTRLGLKEEVLSDDSLWNCTTCFTCQERCPRGIDTTDIVRIIRNLAVKNGHIKDAHRRVCEILFKYGHAVPVNDETRKVRKDLGLAEVPPTVQSDPEKLNEVLEIFEKTGFKKMVEESAK